MTTSKYPADNSLKQELETLSQQQFTGRLDIEANQERWCFYFSMGRLVWASGGLHWCRRWQRFLHQYCPEVLGLNRKISGDRNSDYQLLIQWIKQQKITGAQATRVVRSTVEEVLFDSLQQAEKGELKFARNEQDTIDTPLTLLNPEHGLESAQRSRDLWSRDGLADLSPNLALIIRQPEQLKQQSSLKLHQTLSSVIDGQRTLRELSLLLKQEPLRLVQVLRPYLTKGLMELVEVPDQLPAEPTASSLAHLAEGSGDLKPPTAIAGKTTEQPFKPEPDAAQHKSRSLPFGKWALLALAVLLLGGGYAIWRSQSENSLNPVGGGQLLPPGQLTMVGSDFSGHSTFRSAAFQEALKQADITLNYQVSSEEQSANLLNQGKADLELTTLDQFLQHQSRGKIVGLINHSVGGDAIVLNSKRYPGLKSLLDLNQLIQQAQSQKQQLELVLPANTPSEYLVMVLSAEFDGLNLSNFHVKKTANTSEDWKLLHDDRQNVVATVLREPDITHARQQGYSVVLSSQDTPEEIIDVLVASNSLVQSQPEKIAKLLEVYYRRVDADARDASRLKQQIAAESKLSPADATAVMQGIQFFSALEARDWMKNGKLEKRVGSTAAILTLAGKMNQVPPTPKALFTAQFLNQAATNTEVLIQLVRANNPKLADQLSGKAVSPASKLNQVSPDQITRAPVIGDLQLQWGVKFDTGSTHLTDAGQRIINRLAQEISAEFNPQTVAVEVIGHTSQVGSATANQTLSQKRAQTVVDQLKRLGLPHAIIAEGKGSSEPLPEMSPTDPRNQRTEIRLVHLSR